MSVLIPKSASFFFSSDSTNQAQNVSADGSQFTVVLNSPLALPKGVMDFNFSTGAPTGWIPSKSYFRIEMKLNGAGGNQPTISQQLAFADSACANLFDNVYFKGAGQDISSAVNYVAQSAALKNRLQKSGAWLQSVGKSAYMLNADFQERVAAVSSDDRLNASSQQEYAAVADA